jgi:hypothetical protein
MASSKSIKDALTALALAHQGGGHIVTHTRLRMCCECFILRACKGVAQGKLVYWVVLDNYHNKECQHCRGPLRK